MENKQHFFFFFLLSIDSQLVIEHWACLLAREFIKYIKESEHNIITMWKFIWQSESEVHGTIILLKFKIKPHFVGREG